MAETKHCLPLLYLHLSKTTDRKDWGRDSGQKEAKWRAWAKTARDTDCLEVRDQRSVCQVPHSEGLEILARSGRE